ncbi:MAG TPA: methyltransferase domain-containing protein [Anaerolineae bacterium]
MEIRERVESSTVAKSKVQEGDDLLWRHLKTVPAFRALLRAVEARFYQHINLPEPVLDVGCGDGHFAQMTFREPLAAGIDPWWGPLQKARRTGMYGVLAQSLGDHLPFPDNCFGSAFSNSVLEHIPDVQPVLSEINRVLQPGGRLLITTPSHHFTQYLGGACALERLGLRGLAGSYRRFFNFISRHAHTDSPQVWAERLAQAGFSVEQWQYYFSKEALRALEWGHVQGLPSAVLHGLTGHWILAPWESNLRRTERWLRPFYEEEAPERGAYILMIARKQARDPIAANLPPASPEEIRDWRLEIGPETDGASHDRVTTLEEELDSEMADSLTSSPVNERSNFQPLDFPLPSGTQDQAQDRLFEDSEPRQDKPTASDIVSIGLVGLSLALAIIGQSILSRDSATAAAGLRWYGYSAIILLILAWRQRSVASPATRRWRLPRLSEVPPRRWLYLLSLILAFVAHGLVARFSGQQPVLALLLWFTAIATAVYALTSFENRPAAVGQPSVAWRPAKDFHYTHHASRITHHASRITHYASHITLLTAAILFLVAFMVRIVALPTHPFVLSGIEANLGLDALNIVNGQIRSPFATGWLTNPTLPLYLLALSLNLFGRSVLALRILSPVVGAITIVATFLIGQRLWGRAVGLVAAILLAGSHFHLHYSRLGLTNIWDPLLVLLALGLTGIAWQSETGTRSRRIWLLAGLATGLNAYFFTASRLLPIMLAILLMLALLFDRANLQRQWQHVLAAAALALVVALPQLLYYNNNPGIFMDRANTLGILDNQSGWLAQEAARTGLSRNALFWQQFWRAALSFNSSLDNSPAYRPQAPLLTFGPAVFFVLGLFIAALRLRQVRYALLVVWVIVTVIFAGALLVEPPNSHRLVIATPALSLLAAIALVEFGRLFLAGKQVAGDKLQVASHAFTRSQMLLPLLVMVATLLALNDVAFYFGRYRTEHNFADRNTEAADNIAAYLAERDEGWTAYFYGAPAMFADFPTIPFLAGDAFQPGVNLFDISEAGATLPPAGTENFVFMFLPERLDELAPVQNHYPGGQLLTFNGYHANPLFHVYEVQR